MADPNGPLADPDMELMKLVNWSSTPVDDHQRKLDLLHTIETTNSWSVVLNSVRELRKLIN